MKKILSLLILLISFILPAKADIMPYYINNIVSNSIGVYQASNSIKVYNEPNEKSTLLLDVSWDAAGFNCQNVSASNLFIVFIPSRALAFLTVVDETDEWVQIVYNKNGLQTGWVKKDDEFKFMNWRTFYSIYARKYGLYYMKDAPDFSKIIYGSNVENAQPIGKINIPQSIRLTTVKGNWLLVGAFDIDKIQKIGWIQWRNTSGEIYLFPAIK